MTTRLWFPKRLPFVAANFPFVVAAAACPDQRRLRRLTYREREEYVRATS